MYLWVVFIITTISHVGLIIIFDKQRRKLHSLRALVRRQKNTINHLETQVRLSSKKLFK